MSFFNDEERKALYDGAVAAVQIALKMQQHEELSQREELIIATTVASLVEIDGSVAIMALKRFAELAKKVEELEKRLV